MCIRDSNYPCLMAGVAMGRTLTYAIKAIKQMGGLESVSYTHLLSFFKKSVLSSKRFLNLAAVRLEDITLAPDIF